MRVWRVLKFSPVSCTQTALAVESGLGAFVTDPAHLYQTKFTIAVCVRESMCMRGAIVTMQMDFTQQQTGFILRHFYNIVAHVCFFFSKKLF